MIIPTGLGTEIMEVWHDTYNACDGCGDTEHCYCKSGTANYVEKQGYFYAFGQPGCLYDSEIIGPFDTEQEAIDDANVTFELELRIK